jgi:16S rRNA pseudouridine516 synthase
MRLDKFICSATELSRNEAKKLLKSSQITVDQAVVKSGSFKVPEEAVVALDGQEIHIRKSRYIMLNKPENFICSTVDELHPSVLHLLEVDKAFDLHIAGRLDADTTGLVLITDDGHWSHQITSPKKACAKRYLVELAEPIEPDAIELFKQGIELRSEKQPTKPAKLEIIAKHQVLLTITEGKYHQVKRMFAAIGNKVVALHREQIGEIELDENLEPGQWRYLTEQEVNSVS